MPANDSELGLRGDGVERKAIKTVDEALGELINAREKRQSWGKKEQEAQARLVELFHKHELKKYSWDDTIYELKELEKIRKAPKDTGEDE